MAAEAPNPGTTAVALPKQFGPYRVVRRLGRGGMGVVYLAEDTRLGRQVAIKVCNVSADDIPALERFRREAKSAASLRHPNLCPVFEFDVRVGIPYLAMAYIEGPTLAEWLPGHTPLEPKTAAKIVAKLAVGMRSAHGQGVIHRDLKPGNVLLDKGEPVIVDFGLARPAGAEANLTRKGAVVGTPSYMAPEQIRADLNIGPACDVYALGVILFELLTGKRPFEGPPGVVLAQILYTAVPRPRSLRPDLDPKLEAVCLKAMAKAPADRYASMTELARALEPFAKSGNSTLPAPRRTPKKPAPADTDTTQPPTVPTPQAPPQHGGVWVHVLLLLACLFSLGAVVSFPWWKKYLAPAVTAPEEKK